MQYSEALNASEALGKIEKIPAPVHNVATVPDVSEFYVCEDQLSFDLKYCSIIETGEILAPTRQEAIETDFYYALKNLTEVLFQDVEDQKEILLSLNLTRKKTIAQELENILTELNDFKPIKTIDPSHLDQLMYASFDSLSGKGMSVFCSRVAYFTTIRLMLIHYWKNLGLLKENKNIYKDPSFTINTFITKSCTNLIQEKNNWRFAKQNNYSWYKISPDTLKEIENIFHFWEFKEESISLLSLLYERYLDQNRLRKYSHYTPPLLVKFIWDFVFDHSTDSSLFRLLGTTNIPKLIFDPTMGSGNFLVEAARKMKEELTKNNETDPKKFLKEYSQALTAGLFGCDIDSFAHFFSEVKMLWLMSSIIQKSEELGLLKHQRNHLALSIIHQNALKLYSEHQLEMGMDCPVKPGNDKLSHEANELSLDIKYGLMPLEGHLKSVHSKIKLLEKFDICIGCPPEQFLKEQSDLIKEIMQKIPYWKTYYENNLLHSSWFFILGLSKLREGGKLIFITENYWPTEEGASKLRKYLLQESKILSIIDLGKITMEEDSTALPRYITLLEKSSNKEERDNHKVKIIKVHPQEHEASAAFILGKIAAKAKTVDRPGKIYADDDLDIFYSGIPQGELNETPWQHIYDTGFSQILKQILSFKTTLHYFCTLEQNPNPPEGKDVPILMTPEVSVKNQFSLYDKKHEHSNMITLTPKPLCKESSFYILSLLNSPVLDFWYTHNGNRKSGKKFFDLSSLKMIPIRPISFAKPMDPSLYSEKIGQLQMAISKFDTAYLMANLNLELTHGREEIVHDALVLLQKEILSFEKTLLKYSEFFEKESHLPKSQTFREVYPLEKQCALKDHKKVFIQKEAIQSDQFCLTQFNRETGLKNEKEHILLISKDNKMIRIYAEKELLDFIEIDLKKCIHSFWDEIESAIYLPLVHEDFASFKNDIISHCNHIKNKKLQLQKISNELIYKLYGFNIDDPDPKKSKEAELAIEIMNSGISIP